MGLRSILVRSVTALMLLAATSSMAPAQQAAPTLDVLPQIGIEALTAQAAAGDSGAALILGKVLSDRMRSAEEQMTAVELLRQASTAGIVEASVRLADILRGGITGVKANPADAIALYEVGVTAGDNTARRGLAAMLLSGQGVPKDPARATSLLEAAAAAGNVDARLTLADLYGRGEVVEADPDRAVALYTAALVDSNRGALNGLAGLYRRGSVGMPPAPELAFAYYQLGADLKDAGAIRSLADMLIRGEGTAQDVDGAISILEALAETDAAAFIIVGDYFLAGQVVPRDAERAAGYYEVAATNGLASALIKLGDLYRSGSGTIDIDAPRAYAYYQRASGAGDPGAMRKLAEMQARGEGTAYDLASATSALEAAGDAGSLILLGDLYSRGEVTDPDIARAAAYYQAAADAGNVGGFNKLAEIYRNGVGGTPTDGERAAAYYEQAIAAGDNGARRALASMLIDARIIEPATERAVDLLQVALAAGDAQAGIDLGNAYARGALGDPDYDLTVAAFDAAALKGNVSASWRKYVAILNGPLAAEAGAEARSALEDAAANGTPGVAFELARLIAGGKVAGANVGEAIDLLVAIPNDANAVRYLLQLYREGMKDQLPTNPDAAQALIEASASLLGPETTRFERILLNASVADSRLYPAIASDFAALTRSNGVSAVQRLRQINQNAYVYVVQAWLAETGRYSGSLSGSLSQATITAFNAACAAAGKAAECSKGPLSSEAANVISTFMFKPPAVEATEGA